MKDLDYIISSVRRLYSHYNSKEDFHAEIFARDLAGIIEMLEYLQLNTYKD